MGAAASFRFTAAARARSSPGSSLRGACWGLVILVEERPRHRQIAVAEQMNRGLEDTQTQSLDEDFFDATFRAELEELAESHSKLDTGPVVAPHATLAAFLQPPEPVARDRPLTEDEFVELVNNGADPVDISGWTLESTSLGLRHTFGASTTVAAGGVLLVFGGGTPGALCFPGVAFADEGPDPTDATENPTIDDLFLGQHWFGAEIEDEDLLGKVVLFEIWGS